MPKFSMVIFFFHLGFVELPHVRAHAMCLCVRGTSLFNRIGELHSLIVIVYALVYLLRHFPV